jgi:hypothetical protein
MSQNLYPDEYYDSAKLHADNGEVSDAKELLHGFCTYYENGMPIPEPILNHLYEAFADYLHGSEQNIAKSLKLTAKAKRPKGTSSTNPIRLVARLYLYIYRDGMTKEKAAEKLIEHDKAPYTDRHIQRLDMELNQIKNLSIEQLEYLADLPKRPDKK